MPVPTDAITSSRTPTAEAALPFPAQPTDGTEPQPERRVEIVEHELTFDGFRYTCRIARQGRLDTEPIVILGGSSQDRHSWQRHEKWLTPLSSVITVDLPGYGTADFLPAKYGVDFLAAAVRHTVQELRIPRVNLVAACYGGAIGVRFAQHYPHLLERMMLVGMTTVIPADYAVAMERWDGMIRRGETEPIARELADRFMSPPGTGHVRKKAAVARLVYQQIAAQNPEQLRMSAEHNSRLMRHEWYRPEPTPAVPSLVVTGEHDTLTTPAMGRTMAACLPAARFMTIEETDHLAPVERIADFADLIARFCTDRPLEGLPYAAEPEVFGSPLPA